MGDLTFLHDLTGLLIGEGEPVPDLTSSSRTTTAAGSSPSSSRGRTGTPRDYRRVFGTPHGRDLVAVAQALGWAASRGATRRRARGRAGARGGPRVVVVRTDQRAEAALARELAGGRGARPGRLSAFSPVLISCGSLAVSSREPCGRACIVVSVTGTDPVPDSQGETTT